MTNGMGTFASSSLVGCNTRRYHSLLCAATNPPLGRVNLLSRVAETLTLERAGKPEVHDLACNQFKDVVHPHGEQYLRKVEIDDTVRWTYLVGALEVKKEFLLCWKRNLCGLRYRIANPGARATLDLRPLLAMRDFHAIRRGESSGFLVQSLPEHVAVREGSLTLHLTCDRAEWAADPQWWHGHFYRIEHERGLDNFEDLYSPGRFSLTFANDLDLTLWASLDPVEEPDWNEEFEARQEATARAEGPFASASPMMTRRLLRSAADFVVARKTPSGQAGTTILAGYPWFSDWGRDSMIALPGLLLSSRRFDEARQVLGVFAEYVSEGMIPNVFDDRDNTPHYNTVDASLWFIHTAHEYHRLAGDEDFYRKTLRPACENILHGYQHGTRFGIHMDGSDGLIMQGDASTQLTWMDAKCDGIAFTPRQGKAVEINALWYNALVLMGEEALAEKTRRGFERAFWISPFRGLYDVVNGEHHDASIRPNQIFAVSLPHSPLSLAQQRAVVEVVRRELLTPYGLRTLAASDPRYVGRFEGSPRQRDGGYHNGAVWPWLIGPFLEAYLKTHERSPAALDQAKQWLTPLLLHLDDGACVGQVAEIYDGDAPQRPGGCCAQAWSVAEVLRLAMRLDL
jgi:predicted glycogen debranching enzyme